MEKYLPEICDIQFGFPFDSSLFSETEGTPVIRIRDVMRGWSEIFTTESSNESYIVYPGDMLIGMDGEFNIAKWGNTPSLLNQRVCRLFFRGCVEPEYIFYFMQKTLKNIEARTPFATVKHLSAKELNRIRVPLPSMEEQRKIGSSLNKVTSLISLRKQQLAKLDELVKSRFIEMFGDPSSGTRWRTKKLPELGELNRGVSKHRPRNAPELLNGAYPLVQTGDVSNAGLYITRYDSSYSEIGLSQSRLWSAGTLCITIAANIAQTAILTFDACFPDSVVGFVPYGDTNAVFVHYWFGFFQKILEEQAPQVAQKNINLKILSNLDVIVPPLPLQNEFTTFVRQTDKSKLVIQQSLEQLETLKKSLMQKYLG